MSVDTLANAKAELVGLLSSGGVPTIAGVDAVYDHLPPTSTMTGAINVSVFTAGIEPEFWLIAMRVTAVLGIAAKATEDAIDVLLPLIDRTTNNGHFGPAAWAIAYPTGSDTQAIEATCVYQVGRADVTL